MMPEQVYTYSFSVWPDETKDWNTNSPMFRFLTLCGRREDQFTEKDFEHYRAVLLNNWITLREIERYPYFEPEGIL